jgi:hypothetical protein
MEISVHPCASSPPKTSIEYALRSPYHRNSHSDKGFSRYIMVGPGRIASHFRCHGTFQESGLSFTCSNVSSKHTANNISALDIKVYHLPRSCVFHTPHRASIYIPSKQRVKLPSAGHYGNTNIATVILNVTGCMKVVSLKIRPLCPRKKSPGVH